jgi:DNA-binding transcriptional MerR regulator
MLVAVDELLVIGEFSRRFGLSPKVLRTYADSGVLMPTAIDPSSGYRYYSPGQVREARTMGLLRQADVPLVDIRAFLRGPTRSRLERWDRRLSNEFRIRREPLAEVGELLALSSYPRDRLHRILTNGGQALLALHAEAASQTGLRACSRSAHCVPCHRRYESPVADEAEVLLRLPRKRRP